MILDKPFPTDLRVQNEATSLIDAGHSVGVLSIAPYPKSKIITHKGIKVYQNAVSVFQSKKMHGLAGMIPWMDWHVAKQVFKIFEDEKYDAIHFHDLYMFGAAKILKSKLDVFLVGDLHEFYVEVLPDYKWTQTFPNRLFISYSKWKRKEKDWLALMDRVVVVNSEMKEKTIPKGVEEEDIVIVENRLNTKVFDDYETDQSIIERFENTFNLLFVGGFVGNRGLEHVVDAMSKLEEIDDIRLVLVGDGALRPILEQKVKDYGLESRVFFEGWQSQEKVKSYLIAGDIGLVPFKRTPQTDNSSPNKLFQYMYYGLPIISTDCPSIKEIVETEEVGVVYESENVDQLVQSILDLYQDETRYQKYYERGKKAVKEKLDWESNIDDLIKMYSSLG